MYIGGWRKYFTDFSYEDGNDFAVDRKIASWSKGRLSNIERVELYESNLKGILSLPDTQWHQFDRFIAYGGIGKLVPQRQYRAVQALIKPEHVGYFISYKSERIPTGTKEVLYTLTHNESDSYEHSIKIQKNLVGYWATLVVYPLVDPRFAIAKKGQI